MIKTWAVFAAASLLLILVAVTGDNILPAKVEVWMQRTHWFLALLFGALGITFSIQLVHCTALSSFWPSLVLSLVVCVFASLSFAGVLTWGVGIGLALIAASAMAYKIFNAQSGRNHES